MRVSRAGRVTLRTLALGYLAVLLAFPIVTILWRTFQPGLGAFWDAIRTPAAISALNLTVLILVMGVLDSTRVFRLSRAVAVDIAVMDFVEAAKLRGEKGTWVIFREILPNALSPLVAEFGLRFIFAVLFISTLSFLGLGVQPPLADWGGMVKENKDGLIYGKSAALLPAGAIAALAISVNLVADWVLTRTSSLKGGRGG